MKKTMVSLAAATMIATTAMAADKGIDFVVSGQAVVYTQTASDLASGSDSLYSPEATAANFAVQLNGAADLGNGFALGAQLTHLSTAGLQYNFVDEVNQNLTGSELSVTKMNLAKKIGNTTVKLGRQELPKSLSPLAFSEGWNVVKNTFDAALVVNSDIPGVTLVGAAVDNSNDSKSVHDGGSLSTSVMNADTIVGPAAINGGALMLTAQTTLVPMSTVTASYYALGDVAVAESATALWVDAKVADKALPMGLKLGVQYGQITPEGGLDATTAMGVKLGLAPVGGLNICLAYSSVNDGAVKVANVGTGIKTPLYTQMIANQGAIKHDNSTIMARVAYALGGTSKIIAQYSTTTDANSDNAGQIDNADAELIYKVKAGGIDVLAAYVNKKDSTADDATNIIRVVARYAF